MLDVIIIVADVVVAQMFRMLFACASKRNT